MKRFLKILTVLLIVCFSSTAAAPPQPQSVRIKDRATNRFADVLQTAATLAANIFGLVTDSVTYYFSDGNWRRWSGDTLNSDVVAANTRAPYVGSFVHYFVGGVWQRLTGRASGDAINPVQQGVDTIAYTHFLNATGPAFQRWTGMQSAAAAPGLPIAPWTLDIPYFYNVDGTQLAWWSGGVLDDDAVVTTSIAPYVGGFTHTYNTAGDVWLRTSSHAAGDALSATQMGVDVLGHTLFYNGTNFQRWTGTTAADGLALPTAPWTLAALMGFDGATMARLIIDAVGGLLTGRTWTIAGEDSANDWTKGKKEEIAVYLPPPEGPTAIDDAVTDFIGIEVFAPDYILNTPNITIYVVNNGGGSGDTILHCYLVVSFDGTAATSKSLGGFTDCDGHASGAGSCVFQVPNSSYAWAAVECICDTGEDTTVTAYMSGNKN